MSSKVTPGNTTIATRLAARFSRGWARRALAEFEGILSFRSFDPQLYRSASRSLRLCHAATSGWSLSNHSLALGRLHDLQLPRRLADQPVPPAAGDGRDERHHRDQLEGNRAALDRGLIAIREQVQSHPGL